jgi:hypothetical protein
LLLRDGHGTVGESGKDRQCAAAWACRQHARSRPGSHASGYLAATFPRGRRRSPAIRDGTAACPSRTGARVACVTANGYT